MAGKNKVTFEVRMEEGLYKKLVAAVSSGKAVDRRDNVSHRMSANYKRVVSFNVTVCVVDTLETIEIAHKQIYRFLL